MKHTIATFIGLLLLCGCSGSSDSVPSFLVSSDPSISTQVIVSTSTTIPGPWQIVGVYNTDHSIMTAGFLDELHVATGGVIGQMGYSSDGAETWLLTDALSDCRYGMDIVSPKVIWACGGAAHVRKSVDGGRTWQVLAAFGDPLTITNPCHSASSLDENTG